VRRTNISFVALLAGVLLPGAAIPAVADNPFVAVAGAEFRSALPARPQAPVTVQRFMLQQHAVTNAEYLEFLKTHGEWRRDAVPVVMADADYLSHWSGTLDPGPHAAPLQPVTRVSWFAAVAYCEAQHARLPSWYEWEWAAAASARQRDARADAAWRQQVLDWYSQPAGAVLPAVQQGPANFYGLYDLLGVVWEWVEDFNALLPADADPEKFCGNGAQNLEQKENYAVLMRIAMLGSLRASDTGRALGFRCARDAAGSP